MHPLPDTPPAPPSLPGWRDLLGTLTGRAAAVALSLAVVAALALAPLFITPLPVLLGRTLFVALVLLLVYAAAGLWGGRWLPGWVPRWAVQTGAVALAAPLAVGLVYLLVVGGNVAAFFRNDALMLGFMWMAGTGLALGLVLALAAQVREREALIQQQALRFALERSQLERQALDARLRLLQRQIEPHFLFNTLGNVQALVATGSPQAEALLGSLIRYLRAAMPRLDGQDDTLAAELSRVRAYLELMRMRMPDRLSFEIDVDEALMPRVFPALGLLTLVENAVRHGIDPQEHGGRITVRARATGGDAFTLEVEDDGAGIDVTAPPGTGLANLRERIAAQWGARASLELSERAGGGVCARLLVAPPSAPSSTRGAA
jgi:signal transduction histidine kinase